MEGMQKKIAVLNDLSGYGRCSLTAAMPVISALKVQCCPVVTAVLSNKADDLAGPVVERYYPGLFSVVQGALPGVPVKPDPALLHRLMDRMGADPENTLFVGDSNVDIQTAKNGSLPGCGVL